MGAATRQEDRTLKRLQQRREELKKEIRLERNVTVNEPKILGVAALVPAPKPPPTEYAAPDGGRQDAKEPAGRYEHDAERKKEIELVGMCVAMDYERAQGWQVEDVSEEDHGGFDVCSMHFSEEDGTLEGIRYIEVKARSRTGKIRLSSNEWKKARHFGENYWIYVVTGAGTDAPELAARIPNPAARFAEGESIFATGFEIPEAAWRQEAQPQGSENLQPS